jgi:hypothetical protein
MGATFSAQEYIERIRSFSDKELSITNEEEIKLFFMMSSEFLNVFTSSSLEDYRQLKRQQQPNLLFLISQVSRFIIFHG